MTDLREKLLKAGLVSQEQAQAAATADAEKARQKQQARGPRPEGGDRPQGPGGRGGERRDNRGGDNRGGDRRDNRGGDRSGPREPRPNNDRPREPRDNDGKRLSGDEVKRLVDVAQKGKIDQKVRGHRRWYFESRKAGLVPCLEVSDEAAQQLESGAWRICETPRGEVWLVDAETAKELIATDPAWVR